MKKLILGLVLVTTLLLSGCGGASAGTPTVTPTTSPTLQAPPENVTWINPGKVEVGGLYAGAEADYPITVHNGNDYPAQLIIKYRYPDHVGTGYSFPLGDITNWIEVSGNDVDFQPYETKDITIKLLMPEGATEPHKWEFWISVIDNSQSGMVRTELCCRWLITMQ